MKFIFDGYNHIVRLERGELLIESLTKLAREQNIKATWVSGLGGAQWAELGFYNLVNQQYSWKRFDQLLEITSLQGNIVWENDIPTLHLHGTFSDKDYQAIGGHIKELQVGGTCELHLHTIFHEIHRATDSDTGLNLLDLPNQ